MVESSALKAAKKSLKREESGCMKLKALSKAVASQFDDDKKVTYKMIKKWIQKSDKFRVDGKMVSLSSRKRRSASPPPTDKDDSNNNNNKRARVSDDDEDNSSSSTSCDAMSKWRNENKIVLKASTDDEQGSKETKELNSNKEYFPFRTFDSPLCRKHISPKLLRQCTEVNGFKNPTPIQAQSWPILLHSSDDDNDNKKRDIVGIAETGSGKTLAFGLVALSSMAAEQKQKRRKPRMLVLSPTRELAMQSQVVLEEFGSVVGLNSLVVYGGVPKYEQANQLKTQQVDIIVATPGRIKDLIQEGSCNLSGIQHLVLDEADRMLDMGFEEDVKFIVSNCPAAAKRQTSMFSATWPAAIQKIAMEYMVNPVRLYVGFDAIVGSNGENEIDDSLSANKRVTQTVEVIDDFKREGRLQKILREHNGNKNRILVFCLYKKEAERMEYSLKQRYGWNCCSIHGNKNQRDRTAALADFKSGKCPIMVATDVAARGLDIPNVEVVVNYTFPLTIEDYVHRIGRTGRAGKTGVSYTFFQPTDKSHAGELQQVMKQANQPVPEELMKFGSTIKKKEHKLYGNFGPRDNGQPMKKATKITFNYDSD